MIVHFAFYTVVNKKSAYLWTNHSSFNEINRYTVEVWVWPTDRHRDRDRETERQADRKTDR